MKTPTYSELAEQLSRSKGKYDKLTSSTDPAERFTGERMSKALDNKLDFLFNNQESLKEMKGRSSAPSFRQGGDPLLPLYFTTRPAVMREKGFEDAFKRAMQGVKDKPSENLGEMSYYTMGPVSFREKGFEDSFKNAMLDAKYSPSTKGMFKDYFADGFSDAKVMNKWNTKGYERQGLPKDTLEDIYFNARVNQKWGLPSQMYERAKAPTGSFEEVFKRARANPTTTTSNGYEGINVGFQGEKAPGSRQEGKKVSVPGSSAGTANPATSPAQATSTPSQGFRFKPSSGFNVEYATPRIGAQPSLTTADKSMVGNRFVFSTDKKKGPSAMQIAEGIAPFLDNLANLTNPTPKVPVPSLLRTPQFETKFNIEPQIQEMRRGLRTVGAQVDRSVGQGNVAAAYKAKGLADYFRGVGSAYNQKENTERGLRNAQAEAIANVDAANTQIMNNYRTQQMGRDEAERLRRIGLVNNLGEDFMTLRNDRLMKELDNDRFDLLGNVFKDLIYSNPEMRKLFEKQASGGVYNKYGGKIRMKY